MKKIVSSLMLFILLLTGCGKDLPDEEIAELPKETPSDAPVDVVIEDSAPWFATFRIVDGAEDGNLLLAKNGDSAGEVYRLSVNNMELDFTPQDGQLINVYFESVMESFPAQFGGVSAVELTKEDPDDRCGLYLQVLEDLWGKDVALNDGLEVLGLDLSGLTHLCDAEKSAVAHRFGELHGLEVVTGTLEQLVEQGYITATPLMMDGAGVQEPKGYFYEWKNGILYSIDTDEDAVWHLPMLTEGEQPPVLTAFSAQKWRSSLGAYGFSNCSAQRSEDGSWRYTIGAEFIS